jgi:hypothetical protein
MYQLQQGLPSIDYSINKLSTVLFFITLARYFLFTYTIGKDLKIEVELTPRFVEFYKATSFKCSLYSSLQTCSLFFSFL